MLLATDSASPPLKTRRRGATTVTITGSDDAPVAAVVDVFHAGDDGIAIAGSSFRLVAGGSAQATDTGRSDLGLEVRGAVTYRHWANGSASPLVQDGVSFT